MRTAIVCGWAWVGGMNVGTAMATSDPWKALACVTAAALCLLVVVVDIEEGRTVE